MTLTRRGLFKALAGAAVAAQLPATAKTTWQPAHTPPMAHVSEVAEWPGGYIVFCSQPLPFTLHWSETVMLEGTRVTQFLEYKLYPIESKRSAVIKNIG